PSGFMPPDELRNAATANGVSLAWVHDGYNQNFGRMNIQFKPQGLLAAFEDSIIDFTWDINRPERLANVIIEGGTVTLGEASYPTEEYGAIILRANRQQIRYWVTNNEGR
ncbi:MAG: hypothetical protein FWE42_08540, partial [Defluviitaleaceae bacterium]|nr:hypothetical protein [Defluviitaleaceae bacterium]